MKTESPEDITKTLEDWILKATWGAWLAASPILAAALVTIYSQLKTVQLQCLIWLLSLLPLAVAVLARRTIRRQGIELSAAEGMSLDTSTGTDLLRRVRSLIDRMEHDKTYYPADSPARATMHHTQGDLEGIFTSIQEAFKL